MPAPYVTGQKPGNGPDLDNTLDSARALDRHLAEAIRDLGDQPKGDSMTTGGFAASIRAMMDDARAGVEKARAEGLAKVGAAVEKLNEAKAQTEQVAATMASAITEEADAVLAELGQISNLPPHQGERDDG